MIIRSLFIVLLMMSFEFFCIFFVIYFIISFLMFLMIKVIGVYLG